MTAMPVKAAVLVVCTLVVCAVARMIEEDAEWLAWKKVSLHVCFNIVGICSSVTSLAVVTTQ